MALLELNYDDSELIILLGKGNTKAFEAIYTRYWKKLYAFVYRNLHSKEETEEILHEVFLSLWNNRNEATINNLGIYLFIAARNQINKIIRREINFRRYREFEILNRLEEMVATEGEFNELDFSSKLEQVLAKMPEKTALVFKMSKLEQLPIKEIAFRLDLSEKAIEYHITKSMKLVRQRFRDSLSDN